MNTSEKQNLSFSAANTAALPNEKPEAAAKASAAQIDAPVPGPSEFFSWIKRLFNVDTEKHRLQKRSVTPKKRKINASAVNFHESNRSSKWVTLKLASTLTGISEKAIRRKIERNVWLEGKHYRRADGRIFINMLAYEKWTESGN